MLRRIAAAMLGAGGLLATGCLGVAPGAPMSVPGRRGGVTIIGARCASVDSCLLGHVVAADTAAPMVRAAVFLEREAGEGAESAEDEEDPTPVRIVTLTDDQGVFAVVDAPRGRYRLAVYKEERRLEVRGLQLGAPGTTMVPVRLPPG